MAGTNQVVLSIEDVHPTEIRVKPGRCELLLPNGDLPCIIALDNFVPLKRILDLLPGCEKLEVIDQLTPDNPAESGRYLVRAHRKGEVIKGFCDNYVEVS